MATVVCPNCGCNFSVPKKKVSSISCPYCDMARLEFGLDYFDENDNPKEPFSKRHPELTAAGLLGLGLAGKALLLLLDNKGNILPSPESTADSSTDYQAASIAETDLESKASNLLPIDSEEASERLLHYNLSKRHLPKNQRASAAKREEANLLGIDIGNEYTLVDSYDRPYRKKTSI